MKSNNYYITTPIYYPSGVPHMGHAYSSILADVFARFMRNDNRHVFFLTGTDEHGLKIQKAAEKEGLDPLTYCNKISKVFIDFSKKLNLSNDDFIRTTEPRHHKSVNELWNRLINSGDIYLSKYKGWYSVSDEAYYSAEEITEKNGKKVSVFSGSPVEWVEEESFFFKLSSWDKKLLEFYQKNDKFILPISRKNEVVNFVKSGLKDLSISRTSFSWGIKVPNQENHIIYVWLDALTNYLSALNFPDENNVLKQMAEQRFKAGILYSFVPMGHLYQGKQEELFSSIDLPLLFMTGTADDSPVENFDYTYRLPVWEHAGSDEKYLLTLEDGDHMVYNGSRGKLGENPKRDIHEKIINDVFDYFIITACLMKYYLIFLIFMFFFKGK